MKLFVGVLFYKLFVNKECGSVVDWHDMLHDIQANGTALNLPCRFLCDVELLLNVIRQQKRTFWWEKVFSAIFLEWKGKLLVKVKL